VARPKNSPKIPPLKIRWKETNRESRLSSGIQSMPARAEARSEMFTVVVTLDSGFDFKAYGYGNDAKKPFVDMEPIDLTDCESWQMAKARVNSWIALQEGRLIAAEWRKLGLKFSGKREVAGDAAQWLQALLPQKKTRKK